jgi:hypothetical protein
LFSDLLICLDYIVTETENLAELFNELMDSSTGGRKHVDLQAILRGSKNETDKRVSMIVYGAKSDAITFMGDDKGARRISDKLIELENTQ